MNNFNFQDPFVLEHLFHKKTLEDGTVAYWREVKGDGEGYIVLYADGNHLHTYHDPEDFLGASALAARYTSERSRARAERDFDE